MDINVRKLCLRHKWVNASLHWQRRLSPESFASIDFQSPAREHFNSEWGTGYGGIRFCETCKIIDCIHRYKDKEEFRHYHDQFWYVGYTVETCDYCNRRIMRGSWGSACSSESAFVLIRRIAEEMGMAWTGDPRTTKYGSGWLVEFPVAVSRVIERSGEPAAEVFVRTSFLNGDIGNVMETVSGKA